MKKIVSLWAALILSAGAFSQSNPNPVKKVSPAGLAQVVVDALEELRNTLTDKNLTFKSAELEVAATSSFTGGASLEVWVLESSVDITKETTATLTFELSDPLEKVKEETLILATIESMASNSPNKVVSTLDKQKLKSFSLQTQSISGIENAASYDVAMTKVASVAARKKDAYQKAKSALIESVLKSIEEYKTMKSQFGSVSFSVAINFSVSFSGDAGISVWKIIGAKGGMAKEQTHSLTLNFE